MACALGRLLSCVMNQKHCDSVDVRNIPLPFLPFEDGDACACNLSFLLSVTISSTFLVSAFYSVCKGAYTQKVWPCGSHR
jgi:hypothetical protein